MGIGNPGLSQTEQIPEDPVVVAADEAAARLVEGLLLRHDRLVERQRRVRHPDDLRSLADLPGRLVLSITQPDGPACPIMCRLMEEAVAAPEMVFRAVAGLLCSAQSSRFTLVTHREQLRSLLAASVSWPGDLSRLSDDNLIELVHEAIRPKTTATLWCPGPRGEHQDAEQVVRWLRGPSDAERALAVLRRAWRPPPGVLPVNTEIIFRIPQRLAEFAELCMSEPPDAKNTSRHAEVDRHVCHLARRFRKYTDWGPCVGVPIPLDLLALEPGGRLCAIALVRQGVHPQSRRDLRKRLLFLRFIVRVAFGHWGNGDVRVVAALYADSNGNDAPCGRLESSHVGNDELWTFDEFWDYVTGRANGKTLVAQVVDKATAMLGEIVCQRGADTCVLASN